MGCFPHEKPEVVPARAADGSMIDTVQAGLPISSADLRNGVEPR